MSNDTRPSRGGRAGQTRRAAPRSHKADDSKGMDATTWAFIALVVAIIAGSVYIVVSNRSLGDTGAVQEWSESVTVEGEPLPRFDSENMTTATDPALGAPAPVVTGEDFEGNDVTLPVEGEATVLVFLSHSCNFCQQELPLLLEDWVYGDLPDGVNVAAVATNTNPEFSNFPPSEWLLARDDKWTAPILADTKESEVAQAYGLGAYPFFTVVGADGTVQARTTGAIGRDQLQSLIDIAAGSAQADDVGQSGDGTGDGEEGGTGSE